ncbi:MAG: hypothetical protein AAF959_19695 [Cyanobacteria bacterium P01_D01_bin.56]
MSIVWLFLIVLIMLHKPTYYPGHNYIRLMVKEQLRTDVEQQVADITVARPNEPAVELTLYPGEQLDSLDEELLKDLCSNTLSPRVSPFIYVDAGSPEAAKRIEDKLISRLIADYRRIALSRKIPLVQHLNSLLLY